MTDDGVTVVVFLENKSFLDHCERDVTWQLTEVVFPLILVAVCFTPKHLFPYL